MFRFFDQVLIIVGLVRGPKSCCSYAESLGSPSSKTRNCGTPYGEAYAALNHSLTHCEKRDGKKSHKGVFVFPNFPDDYCVFRSWQTR